MRERAAAAGAGEAVLADADGRLFEGADEPVVVGRGDAVRLSPTTRRSCPASRARLLIEIAGARGTLVERRRPAPADLADRETWLVSALHGIRAVTGWAAGTEAGAASRATS